MNKNELAEAMRAFEQAGKKVTQVQEGEKAVSSIDPALRFCKCGCEGNYTDHSMRQGEGRFRDQY